MSDWEGSDERRESTGRGGRRGDLEVLNEKVMQVTSRGAKEEQRVTFTRAKTSDGKEVAWHSIRVWFLGSDGQMHPGRAGVSIRAKELPLVTVALLRACANRIPPELHGAAKSIIACLTGGERS